MVGWTGRIKLMTMLSQLIDVAVVETGVELGNIYGCVTTFLRDF